MGKIGDTITVPYQILKDDGLDYTKEKDFRICGFLADNESSKEQKQYTSLVSEAFLKAEIPVEQVKYRFLTSGEWTERKYDCRLYRDDTEYCQTVRDFRG